MKNPMPVNLLTSEEVRAEGWNAESRDADGHLRSTHCRFETNEDLAWYVNEETKRGCTVTIWPLAD